MSKKILTKNGKVLTSDNKVLVSDEGGEYPSEAIAYYKQTRNKDYPYFPLPYEMEEEQDTIYMLYDAREFRCCPAFNVTFTDCVCTIQKYMNTTLVSESNVTLKNGTDQIMQFCEEDSDYSTYNYIVIKLQGNITKHYLLTYFKFNGVIPSGSTTSELLEVSGNCVSCDIKVANTNNDPHKKIEYYSFEGVSSTGAYQMFRGCCNLKCIPQLDVHLVTWVDEMFWGCNTLKAIAQLDLSSCTSISNMFSLCTALQNIPQMNTSQVTIATSLFYKCCSLQNIPQLDLSKVTSASSLFYECYNLAKIDILNMSISFSLSNARLFTQNELVNILNNLATVETTQTLTLGSTNLAKLTDDEKAIATDKGWTLA